MAKAEALRTAVLDRFSARDDLEEDPLYNWNGSGHLPWDQGVSLEEVERNTIRVSSTSPRTDRVTVRLLKDKFRVPSTTSSTIAFGLTTFPIRGSTPR
jgi:hypothetical protein